MKTFRQLVTLAFVAIVGTTTAQVDFNNPAYAKWGADAAAREKNMFASTYLKEALEAKNYDAAAKYFQQLTKDAPAASEAVYQRGLILYKAKIARAKSLAEKKAMVDSLMIVHDLRLANFGNQPKRGRAYILDTKARDFFNYAKSNREGMREVFKAAIEAADENTDPALVLLYFQNLCEDYKMDEVMADEVISEYDRLGVYFENLEGDQADMKGKFDTLFGTSGAATCESLEAIYSKKLADAPDDVKILSQAVALMDRTGCTTPFYAATAEKYYAVEPSAGAAMALATVFQNEGDYDKAAKYLSDALAGSTDMEEQEALNSRIALIQLAANKMGAAATAARASLNTADDTTDDNGIAYFVLAQCYGASASACEGLTGQLAYLAAYDTMQRALSSFTAEEEMYRAPAQALLGNYRAFFPTKEECFFNEIPVGSTTTVKCGAASGVSVVVRTRD